MTLPPSPLARRRAGWLRAALALMAAPPLSGCTSAFALRAELREIGSDARSARQQGALHCAPRELALAEANHRFALIELDQGSLKRARTHLRIASLHAQAALDRVSGRTCRALATPSPSTLPPLAGPTIETEAEPSRPAPSATSPADSAPPKAP